MHNIFKINTTQDWWAPVGTVALATPYHVGLVLAPRTVGQTSKGEPAGLLSSALLKKYETRSYSTQADECERGTIRT